MGDPKEIATTLTKYLFAQTSKDLSNRKQIFRLIARKLGALEEFEGAAEADTAEEDEDEALFALLSNPETIKKKMLQAIHGGLDGRDAQMVRQAMNYINDIQAQEYMTSLEVEIVPYTIADTSLSDIVLRAEDSVVEQIEKALALRVQYGRVEDAVEPFEDEDDG